MPFATGAREIWSEKAKDRLEFIMRKPPLQIDLGELHKVLTEAEAEGVDASLLKKGLAKIDYAERVQHAARMKEISKEIEGFLKEEDPLKVDVASLLAAVEFAIGKSGISEDLISRAEAKLQEADEAQARLREQMRAEATEKIVQLANQPPMLLDPERLADAMDEGDEAGVAEKTIELARAKIREATRRNAAVRAAAATPRTCPRTRPPTRDDAFTLRAHTHARARAHARTRAASVPRVRLLRLPSAPLTAPIPPVFAYGVLASSRSSLSPSPAR